MMTIVAQMRARPVQVLTVLLTVNGLAVAAMMAQAAAVEPGAQAGMIVPLLGAGALLATLAAMIALVRLVSDPLGQLETALRSVNAEAARGGEGLSGLGLRLASSGDLTASTRSLLRLRQVLSERNGSREEETRQRRAMDNENAAEAQKRAAENRVRHDAVAELADSLRRMADGEHGLQIGLAMPAELEPVRLHFNRASAILADTMAFQAGHADILRDTGAALSASTELARQGADQASGVVELRRSAAILSLGAAARVEEAQELAAIAAWTRTEIAQCARTIASARTAVDTVARATADLTSTVETVRETLRDTSLTSLNLGIEAVKSGEAGEGLSGLLREVRALADRAARAASSLSEVALPAVAKTAGAAASLDKALTDIEAAGAQVASIEDRATLLGRAGEEDKLVIGEVEYRSRVIEAGARSHAATVERAVLAMSALSRSLGRLELKLGLPLPSSSSGLTRALTAARGQGPASNSGPASPTTVPPTLTLAPTSAVAPATGAARPSGPRPYLRRVK
ncbi:hypothetical protein ACQKKX_01550 [Neorhizobium sp. NPDC001467]|uniref:hypothetical protein n=1 Tax=Neorhizobium sp. NPDC001467 TaxID=3390595 RepID=UPI003CFD5685